MGIFEFEGVKVGTWEKKGKITGENKQTIQTLVALVFLFVAKYEFRP